MFATMTESVLSTHRGRIDALIDAVRRTAAEIFEVSLRQDLEHESFELGEQPYWVMQHVQST